MENLEFTVAPFDEDDDRNFVHGAVSQIVRKQLIMDCLL